MSFRRKPESRVPTRFQNIWTPVCTGVTTSYETIRDDMVAEILT